MASNIPRETSFLVPKEPTRYLPFQMCQSPLVTPTRPLQSSHSVHERDLHQKDSQEPSRNSGMRMQTSVVMGPGLPTLRRLSGQPSHQILSRTSVSSGFPVPIGSMPLSDKYYNKQSGPVAQRQSVFSSPPCSPSSTSPDSESIFSAWEEICHVSFPPPFSPSMFSDPESTLSIIQINENLLSDAMMSL